MPLGILPPYKYMNARLEPRTLSRNFLHTFEMHGSLQLRNITNLPLLLRVSHPWQMQLNVR